MARKPESQNPTAESLGCAMMELADLMASAPVEAKLIDPRSWGHFYVYAPFGDFEAWYKTTISNSASMLESTMPGFKKRMKWAYSAGLSNRHFAAPEVSPALPAAPQDHLHAAIMGLQRYENNDSGGDVLEAADGEFVRLDDVAELVANGALPAAQGEALDAARYRWLRDKSEPGICAFYLSVGKAFDGVKFTQTTVDDAIDAQIATPMSPRAVLPESTRVREG